MKRSVGLWQFCGFAVSSLLGTLLHFLYEWTNSPIVAPFSGVNESTWEHMKLLFWALFVFAIIQSFFFRDYPGFWNVKLRGTLIGVSLIPIIFYLYNGVIGKSPDWVNIAIFFIAAAAAYIYEAWLFSEEKSFLLQPKYALLLLAVTALVFAVFTFKAPMLEIFRDPVTGEYGI